MVAALARRRKLVSISALLPRSVYANKQLQYFMPP